MTIGSTSYSPQLVASDATQFRFDYTGDSGAKVSFNGWLSTEIAQRGTLLELHQLPGAIHVGNVMGRTVVAFQITFETYDHEALANRFSELEACLSGLGNTVRFYLHRSDDDTTDLWYWDRCRASVEGVEIPSLYHADRRFPQAILRLESENTRPTVVSDGVTIWGADPTAALITTGSVVLKSIAIADSGGTVYWKVAYNTVTGRAEEQAVTGTDVDYTISPGGISLPSVGWGVGQEARDLRARSYWKIQLGTGDRVIIAPNGVDPLIEFSFSGGVLQKKVIGSLDITKTAAFMGTIS